MTMSDAAKAESQRLTEHSLTEEIPAEALHTFTHFHLRLSIMVAEGLPASGGETASATLRPGAQGWVPRGDFRPSDMPTVMRKAFDLARSAMDNDA